MLKGTGVSAGVALAKAKLWQPSPGCDYVPRKSASPSNEIDRFEAARRTIHNSYAQLRDKTASTIGQDEAVIFEAHCMILDDEEGLLEPLRKKIRFEGYTAEYAVTTQFDELAHQFSQLTDDYFRQRVDDVLGLRDQLMRELLGQYTVNTEKLDGPTIIVGQLLSPADIANIDIARLEGIVCEEGGYTSHMSIIARTLGIPAVVRAPGALARIKNGGLLGLDGKSGEIWIEPDDSRLAVILNRKTALSEQREYAQRFRGQATKTKDGHRIELAAAIGQLEEVDYAIKADAEALGMFRTERLFLEYAGVPGEEEQYIVYRKLLDKMDGKPVSIRLFDDGGNPRYTAMKPSVEQNPVLGYRGIRICLARPSFFRTQLRAVLRASAHGPLKILLPMVSNNEELEAALQAIKLVKEELSREQLPYDNKLQVGLLMSVPACIIMRDYFAQKVNFFLIDVNDLMQFTLAIDRSNPELYTLVNQYHPAVLRVINDITQSAHSHGIPCALCGEVPNPNQILPLFVGMGLDGFILSSGSILECRQILSQCNYEACCQFAAEALQLDTIAKVRHCVENTAH